MSPEFVLHLAAASRLIEASTTRTLSVDDPVYKQPKTYEGVVLGDLIARAVPSARGLPDDAYLVLVAVDGYRSTVPLTRASHAVLAFRDVAAPSGAKWTPFSPGSAVSSPSPYYLVWPRGTSGHVPWPYGVIAIEVWQGDPLALATPPAGGDAAAGFAVFRNKCISCHSMNGSGGTLGPELNVPANVTEYWRSDTLRQFIRDPASIRANAKMPKPADLDDETVRVLEEYLREMRNHKFMVHQRP